MPAELSDDVLDVVRDAILSGLARPAVNGVILDVSAVELLGVEEFRYLRETAAMAGLMGSRTVWVGLTPGVVSALIDLDANVAGVDATLSVDDAFAALASKG